MNMKSTNYVMPREPTSTRRRTASKADGDKLATDCVDVDPRASHGYLATRKNPKRLSNTRIGTLNVRGLNKAGKLQILENELTHCKFEISGISETWSFWCVQL